ncbi:TPA: hypothetical protein MYP51_001401 [Citrobacter farmeri]|nr:hypothetical protein [Citrobacter farmeri]HCB1606078.1 hypothetical protein [Citrobacter farmeri]
MAAESWVTIGGFIATTASAVAAFFAVKQTMLQRTILTKPQLIINSQEVKTLHTSDSIFRLKFENTDFYNDIPITIKNVGLGTALNINYNWTFDYKNTAKRSDIIEINQNKMHALLKKQSQTGERYFELSDDKESDFVYFQFYRYGISKYYGIKREHKELEYIMPVTQENTPSKIEFPALILLLLSEMAFSETASHDAFFDVMDAGQLNIKYEDISGNKKTIRFRCTLQLIRFQSKTENGPSSTFRIEFNRIHSESRLGLQRLRKSYADFMNKYNFNKNK